VHLLTHLRHRLRGITRRTSIAIPNPAQRCLTVGPTAAPGAQMHPARAFPPFARHRLPVSLVRLLGVDCPQCHGIGCPACAHTGLHR
jgi:hypothetical protein